MNTHHERLFFLYLSLVPLLGIAAQWLAWRIRLPSILLLLAFGVVLGRFLNPDEVIAQLAGHLDTGEPLAAQLLFPLVSLCVAVILFEGGLSLRFHELRASGWSLLRLVTIGVLVSWGLTTVAASTSLGMDTRIAALFGAVLVVTGPTVVGPLLRHIRPVRKVASVAKWEGIVIDPIGAVLAVLVFEEVLAHRGGGERGLAFVVPLVKTVVIGCVLGGLSAAVLIQLVRRYWIPDYLHGVVFLAAALGTFAASNLLQEESGLVTVTVLGIILANQRAISIHHVVEFKEHLGVFLISCLFIVLGSRIDPVDVWSVGVNGVVFLAVLILVVRPASVYLATVRSELNWRERTFLAFLAPRGIVAAAVTAVFALKVATVAHTDPGLAGLASEAERLVPLTFLVIVGTVAVYGLLAAPLARWLELADVDPQGVMLVGGSRWIREIAKALQEVKVQVLLIDTNYTHVAAAKMEGIPAECASILSEHVREEMDLAGIGRLLAMTPNDEVNALAAHEFDSVFGRANVFQLVSEDEHAGRRSSLGEHLRGRLLFDKRLHYGEIEHRAGEGAQIKTTRLTDAFGWNDFRQRYGASSVVLFSILEGKLKVHTVDDEPPEENATIIALIDKEEEPVG